MAIFALLFATKLTSHFWGFSVKLWFCLTQFFCWRSSMRKLIKQLRNVHQLATLAQFFKWHCNGNISGKIRQCVTLLRILYIILKGGEDTLHLMTIYGTHLVINEDVFVSSLSRFLLLSWQKMKGFPLSYFLDRETEVVLQCVPTSLGYDMTTFFKIMFFRSVKLWSTHFLLTAEKPCLLLCNCFRIYYINYYIREIAQK